MRFFYIIFVPKSNKLNVHTFKPLEIELTLEDMEGMKDSAIDFLLKDIENLKLFIKKMRNDFGQHDLAFILRMFVLNRNKVFNMASYMDNQSRLAEEYVKSQGKAFSPEERRAVLNEWIKNNAGPYRKYTIFKQIRCIEKKAKEIVPVIKKAIEE